MSLVEVNGVRLLVEDVGSGDPLVLVHGSWVDHETWGLVRDDLASSYRVISYDRRGHSGSEDTPGPGTRRDDEDDLAALIETLGAVPAHVVANSFGGSISLGLVSRRPELFRSVYVHEPPLCGIAADDPSVAAFVEFAEALVGLINGGEREGGARGFVDAVAGPGVWEVMPASEQMRMVRNATTFAGEAADPERDLLDLGALGGLPVPVLLTEGDESPPMFHAVMSRLVEAMSAAHVKALPGAGHVPHLTNPQEWMALVRAFVSGAT